MCCMLTERVQSSVSLEVFQKPWNKQQWKWSPHRFSVRQNSKPSHWFRNTSFHFHHQQKQQSLWFGFRTKQSRVFSFYLLASMEQGIENSTIFFLQFHFNSRFLVIFRWNYIFETASVLLIVQFVCCELTKRQYHSNWKVHSAKSN